jgi:hypothetical protein
MWLEYGERICKITIEDGVNIENCTSNNRGGGIFLRE